MKIIIDLDFHIRKLQNLEKMNCEKTIESLLKIVAEEKEKSKQLLLKIEELQSELRQP